MNPKNESPQPQTIIFFDGVCNLCNFFIDFVVKHDRQRRFMVASLQGRTAKTLLPNQKLSKLDTVILYDRGVLKTQSSAALEVICGLGGFWRVFNLFFLIPKPIRDAIYTLIANNRYRVFGQRDTCRLPTPEEQTHFLD